MFWKRKSASGEQSSSEQAIAEVNPGSDQVGEAALDTVVAIFRAFGRHAFEITGIDMATFRRLCDTWAEHLAVGSPHPDAGTSTDAVAKSDRDFIGARRFFVQRRQDESAFLAKNLGDLREVVADLTERFATSLIADQETGHRVTDQVERLRTAANEASIEAVRLEVISVADLLTGIVDQHSQRVRGQLAQLDQKVLALSEELQELKYESSLDPLTRVYNRGAFDTTFRRIHRINVVSAQPSTLMLADLDNLKQINDVYGHQAGDEALRVFADCLVRNFPRRSDFIARYGGDEFVAILPQTPASQSERLVRRFLESVHRIVVSREDQSFEISASMGLAELLPGEDANNWLERADRALLEAKAGGRNKIVIAP